MNSANHTQTGLPTLPYRRVLYRYFSLTNIVPFFQSKVSNLTKKSQFGFKIFLEHSIIREAVLRQFEKLSLWLDSQVYMLQALKSPGFNERIFLIAGVQSGSLSLSQRLKCLEETLTPLPMWVASAPQPAIFIGCTKIPENENRLFHLYYVLKSRLVLWEKQRLLSMSSLLTRALTLWNRFLKNIFKCNRENAAPIRERLREVVKKRFHQLNREAGLRYAETVGKWLE